MARAHGQEEGVLPLGLQVLRRRGDHARIPLGEQLGVELVVAVEDGLLVVDRQEGLGIPVLPGVEHGGDLRLLGLGQRLGLLADRLPAEGGLIHGQAAVQIGLLILGGQSVEDAALEGVGLHGVDGLAGVHRVGVDVGVHGHGVGAGGVVLKAQHPEGGGQGPGLVAVKVVGAHAQGHRRRLHPRVQLGADVVGQGGAVGIGLEGGQQGHALLVVEIQLKAHHLGRIQGVPHRLVQGVGVAAIHVDGAQQVEGVVPVDSLPEQAPGAGVVGVVDRQDQPLGHGHGLLIGAGALLIQLAAPVALHHAQAGEEGLRAILHAVDVVGRRLLIQGVHHAAPGGVHHQPGGVRRPLGQLQHRQLVGHDARHGLQLLGRNRALDISGVAVVHQAQGIAVGQLRHRPGVGQLGRGLLRRQGGHGQQGRGQGKGRRAAHPVEFHTLLLSLLL